MKQKILLIGYADNGAVRFKVYVKINIFTYTILGQVYYTNVKSGIVAFNARFTSDVLEIVTTDPYYLCCRGCDNFKACLTNVNEVCGR